MKRKYDTFSDKELQALNTALGVAEFESQRNSTGDYLQKEVIAELEKRKVEVFYHD